MPLSLPLSHKAIVPQTGMESKHVSVYAAPRKRSPTPETLGIGPQPLENFRLDGEAAMNELRRVDEVAEQADPFADLDAAMDDDYQGGGPTRLSPRYALSRLDRLDTGFTEQGDEDDAT
jgi:hypothetical protein